LDSSIETLRSVSKESRGRGISYKIIKRRKTN
jgi:hypothetical protein